MEMIGGDNLNKSSKIDQDISKQIQTAYSMKNLLEIYKQNQEKITPFNIFFLIREIQTRFYSENSKELQKNPVFQELLQYIERNIKRMPHYTQVEVLTVIRKCYQNGHIDEQRTLNLARIINQLLQENSTKPNSQLNPKLISQAHLDLVMLQINSEHWINLLKIQLHEQKYSPYFTSQTIFNIFKSTELFCKKKHGDFFYALSVKAINIIDQYDIERMCSLFYFISNIQLHFNTSHSRQPQILIALKDQIIKNLDEDFSVKNGINILKGYAKAPHTLDTSLLEKVINQMLKYMNSEKMKLRQVIQFLEIMSQMREGFKMSNQQLENAYKISYQACYLFQSIKKNLDIMQDMNPSICITIIDCMNQLTFPDQQILKKIEASMRSYKELGFTMHLKILVGLLKLKFDASDLRKLLFDRYRDILNQQSFFKSLELIYILNYEIKINNTDHLQYKDSIEQITERVCKLIREYESLDLFSYQLDMFGKNYVAQKSEPFRKINQQFYDVYTKVFDQLDLNKKSTTIYNVCNWNIFDDKWQIFITNQIKQIDDKDFLSWLIAKYIQDPKKIYPKVDVFLQACVYSKLDKNLFLQEKIKALLSSPFLCLQNKKGTAHPLLQQAFECVNLDLVDFKKSYISFSMLIKSQRTFEMLKLNCMIKSFIQNQFKKVPSIFFIKASIKEFNENQQKYLSQDSEFYAAEICLNLMQYEDEIIQAGLGNQLDEILVKAKKSIDQQFEQSNQNFGLSFLQKYIELTAWVDEKKLMNIQQDELQFLAFKLLEKLQNLKVESFINQTLNSILTLAVLDAKQKIQLDYLNQEFLFDTFTKSLNVISVQGFVGYLEGIRMLRFFKLQQLNSDNQSEGQSNEEKQAFIYRYLRKIEHFYITKNLGKLPYVVIEFFTFFSSFKQYYPQPQIYNKLLQDSVNLFHRFKISNIQELIKNIANVKLYHPQVLALIYENFQLNLSHYRSSFQDMVWYFAQLGYNYENQIKLTKKKEESSSSSEEEGEEGSSSSDEEISSIERCLEKFGEMNISQQYRIIWAMIFYNIQNSSKKYFTRLLNEQFNILCSESSKISFSSLSFNLDIISYCLLFNPTLLEQSPSGKEKIIQASQNILKAVQEAEQKKRVSETTQQLVAIINQEKGFEIKQNYIFEEYFLSPDLLIEENNTIILLEQNQFVNYDQQTLSGQGQIRKRLFEKFVEIKNIESEKPYKIININVWKLKNVGQKKEDIIAYLKKQSLLS